MARNYIPAATAGAEVFLDYFLEEDDLVDVALRESIIEAGNPKPTCLMDMTHLWLLSGRQQERLGSYAHAFTRCPTFESYLQTVLILVDLWTRMPERFAWPEKVARSYELEPVAEIFASLEQEDLLHEPEWSPGPPMVRGDSYINLVLAQYDHPALRRDMYDHFKHQAMLGRQECKLPGASNAPAF